MTDSRAALAEILREDWYGGDDADRVVADLAERGVLLVTEERLAAAWASLPVVTPARLFAALSDD